jgi:hypothetical protein
VRRAFRLTVLIVVLFTFGLWFSDSYLQYDLSERKYMSALTLPPSSARPILRQAVKVDEETRESPTPKYLYALAQKEERDLVLPTYARAHAVESRNAAVAMRYGVHLFNTDQWPAAHDVFAQAVDNAPKNVLPAYLRAATAPYLQGEAVDIAGAVGLLTGANNSQRMVEMPRPPWSRALPQRGYWYADQCRDVVTEICWPLYAFLRAVKAEAQKDFDAGVTRSWDTRLMQVQAMGQRLASGATRDEDRFGPPAGSVLQAMAGVTLQRDVIALREQLREVEGRPPDEELLSRRLKLTTVLEQFRTFEGERAERVAESRATHGFVLGSVVEPGILLKAIYVLILFYLVMAFASTGGGAAWCVPHGRVGSVVIGAGSVALFCMLIGITACQQFQWAGTGWMPVAGTLWWGIVLAWMGFACVWPVLSLPSAEHAAASKPEHGEDAIHAARKQRRRCVRLAVRRHLGILLGSLFIVSCFWVIVFSILTNVYPWQTEFLASGLAAEEVALVRDALAPLL